jgi:hypothetical protein
VSWSFAKRPVLQQFQVAASGGKFAGGDAGPLRFATAFDTSARLLTLTNPGSVEECALQCVSTPDCKALFWWEQSAALVQCYLLRSVGGGLLSTSSNSLSFARLA